MILLQNINRSTNIFNCTHHTAAIRFTTLTPCIMKNIFLVSSLVLALGTTAEISWSQQPARKHIIIQKSDTAKLIMGPDGIPRFAHLPRPKYAAFRRQQYHASTINTPVKTAGFHSSAPTLKTKEKHKTHIQLPEGYSFSVQYAGAVDSSQFTPNKNAVQKK